MKNLFAFSIFYGSFILGCFGQDWAPFYYNKRMIYGTPDTLSSLLTGQTLAVMRFDTSYTIGGKVTMFCKKGLGPDVFSSEHGNSKSLVSLYGKKMIVDGNKFWFHNQVPTNDSILYNSQAAVGQLAISSPRINGTVIEKTQVLTILGMDSVKIISIQETNPGSGTSIYTAKVSKNYGFLSVPSFFYKYPFSPRSVYTLLGDYDNDLKKIKSHPFYMNRYQLGDKMISIRNWGWSSNYWGVDSLKSEVISVSGDSCLILDSAKTFYGAAWINLGSYVQTRKVLNSNFNLPEHPDGLTIGTLVSWHTTAAMLTKDSVLFIGERPCLLGLNDGQFINFRCTQLPVAQMNDGGMFYSNGINPIFFQRGDTTVGTHHSILFTPTLERIFSKLQIYPNPFSDRVVIGGPLSGTSILSIFNSQGVLVWKQEVELPTEIHLQPLPIGLYQLHIQTGDKIYTEKILKN